MDIDNDLYNRMADSWWDEKGVLWLLQTAMNPVRFEFFKEVLLNKLKISLEGKHTLDVGCGGGFLAEEFARLGCRVTGLDPSVPSLKAAKTHAKNAGLQIDYQIGKGEDIPFEGNTFDIVCCCDVLEHISDWQGVVLEIRAASPPSPHSNTGVAPPFYNKLCPH